MKKIGCFNKQDYKYYGEVVSKYILGDVIDTIRINIMQTVMLSRDFRGRKSGDHGQEEVFSGVVSREEKTISFEISRPKDEIMLMAINMPNAALPLELGISDDFRKRSLRIRSIRFFE